MINSINSKQLQHDLLWSYSLSSAKIPKKCRIIISLLLRYIFGGVTQDQLAAFYRDASVGLITPLRDGMNLVAKEFVACQPEHDPGVLILSPFAGAGGLMQEALQVTINDLDS